MCWAQEPGNLIRTPPGYHASLMSVAHHPSSRETLFHSRPDTSPANPAAPGRAAAFAFFFPSGMPPEIFGGSLMSGMAADDQWRGFPRQCHLTVPANAPREPRCQSYYWLYCSFSHSPDHRSLSSFHASSRPCKASCCLFHHVSTSPCFSKFTLFAGHALDDHSTFSRTLRLHPKMTQVRELHTARARVGFKSVPEVCINNKEGQ